MKKLFKSLAIAGLATGALLSTAGLASAQQTASLTVVIDKIELMTNGDAIPVTVYQPSAGIAATATTTIDLFNASQKLGVRLPIAAPQAGTYNTMLVTFSTLTVGNGVGSRNLVTELQSTRQIGTDTQGRGVLVFGSCGTASGGTGGSGFGVCADLRPGLAGTDVASAGVIQPIISTGLNTAINLPALNLLLPRAQVNISGTTVSVSRAPVMVPVASQAVDNAFRPNVVVAVSNTAFVSVGTTGSPTHAIRVGLWECAAANDCASGLTSPRPMVSTLATVTSGTNVTAATVTEATLVDVPDGFYFPIAWRDANNNGLLDPNEYTAVYGAAANTANNILQVVSDTSDVTKDGTYGVTASGATRLLSWLPAGRVAASGLTGTGGLGLDSAAANGILGGASSVATAGFAFGPRAIDLTIAGPSTVNKTTAGDYQDNATTNNAAALRGTLASLGGAILANAVGTVNLGELEIAYQLPAAGRTPVARVQATALTSRTIVANVRWAAAGVTNPTQLENAETAHAVFIPTALADTPGVAYEQTDVNTGVVRVSNVPYVAINALGSASTMDAEYIVHFASRVPANPALKSTIVRLSKSSNYAAGASTALAPSALGVAAVGTGIPVTLGNLDLD
jgi:hypothetical protein